MKSIYRVTKRIITHHLTVSQTLTISAPTTWPYTRITTSLSSTLTVQPPRLPSLHYFSIYKHLTAQSHHHSTPSPTSPAIPIASHHLLLHLYPSQAIIVTFPLHPHFGIYRPHHFILSPLPPLPSLPNLCISSHHLTSTTSSTSSATYHPESLPPYVTHLLSNTSTLLVISTPLHLFHLASAPEMSVPHASLPLTNTPTTQNRHPPT